jgi:hypothetical protein
MAEIRIEKAGGRWLVICDSFEASWNDLDFAACSALSFAALMRVEEPALGEGVPSDALTRGQQLRERLARR